ncbi:dual specificity protein phosphatase family protein [Microcoleus sp. LEGE 07076]|uniref:protein-tyrosine phosphatase family protein n=1 Tax=Microcoleus sp. LEGE 07076 TaxID=915322 RepID=UPI001881BDA6|nr:dual specificity protein phosphatase family protein [Microcoleus sp. LEGE 07076]MBE9184162.1 dual specificity protein phosphatase family protein [Microcoleus sp. LEGE 07076]
MYKFAAASEHELIVFGAARPGYRDEEVARWIDFMRCQTIDRVCCLLPDAQLVRYGDLLGSYRNVFGRDRVCWAPIADFELADRSILVDRILPFLISASRSGDRVVVHCGGGIGRTGQVLAAWLVSGRGFSNQEAIAAVKKTGRNPYEAAIAAFLKGRNPWQVAGELDALLDCCRRDFGKNLYHARSTDTD